MLHQVSRAVDAIVDVDDTPLAIQTPSVRRTVSGTAAIIDVKERHASTRPVLDKRIEGGLRGGRGASVNGHQKWRLVTRGRREVLVSGRVIIAKCRAPARGRKLDMFRD